MFARPRLSWRIESDVHCIAQSSYRIRAAASRAALLDGKLVWDSGTVAGDRTFDVAYGGSPLKAMERVWWTVEAEVGDRSVVSDPAWFEAGLPRDSDWQADWLEAEDDFSAAERLAGLEWIWDADPLAPAPHAFRLDFDAPEDLARAEVFLSGKDHLRGAWINGEPATLDRDFGWGTYLPFWGTLTQFDGSISPGHNSVCALVEADVEGFFPVDGGAFAALIRLYRNNGKVDRIVSGPRWKVCPAPPSSWHDASFDARDWTWARPSGANVHNDPRPGEPAMRLRTEFKLDAAVVSARLYATALGAYDARINGQAVSAAILAPEITVASDHLLYQTYDVTNLLQAGANALAATVGDGWYASPFGWRVERYGFGPAPRRFRAQLRVDLADGSTRWIRTGPGWAIGPSPIIRSEIYDGETFDAREEQDGWDRPGFAGEGWHAARIGQAPGTPLIGQTSPLLEHTRTLPPVSVSEVAPGMYVADFGQNFSGWVRLTSQGSAGTEIVLRFAELLNADGSVDQSNLRLAKATDRFILQGSGHGEVFEPTFTYHGFRYVQVEGFPGIPGEHAIEGIVVHSACEETGRIEFPDSRLLQTINSNTLWSQRSNFFSVPTDCPQRDERMGWMGDIQVFLDAAAFNMQVDPFIRRFLLEARTAQREDGGYPIVVPQPKSFPDVVTAGWSEAGIILPWQLWQRYGDTAVIAENWVAMEAWMAFVERGNPDGIVRNDRGLDLGDWLSVDAVKPDDETTPRVICATAFYALAAEQMAAMASACNRLDDAERYHALRAHIGTAFAAEFVTPDGKVGNGSQASQILALHMGLVPDDLKSAAAAVLARDIASRGMKLSTGFLGTPYILDVLVDTGYAATASALLLQTEFPSWGYMPSQGATTIWERWNGDTGDLSMNSFNHYAFGAIVGFFYRRLAGIAPAAPGFRAIAARPLWLPDVGRVRAMYESASRNDRDVYRRRQVRPYALRAFNTRKHPRSDRTASGNLE